MTWLEFNTAVRVHLVSHNRRQGIQPLIDTLIKAAVWDLQASIPFYVSMTRRSIAGSSLKNNGFYASGTLPAGSKISDVYVQDVTDGTLRARFNIITDKVEFERMQTGEAGALTHFFYYVPTTGVFFISPNPVLNGSILKIEYANKKLDYENDDDVLFDEKAAEAVSSYVNARLSAQVDRDAGVAGMHQNIYVANKRKLYSELNDVLLVPKQDKLT